MYVGMRMAFPTSSLHASLFYKSLRFALAFTFKLYNYVASFFSPADCVYIRQLNMHMVQSTHTVPQQSTCHSAAVFVGPGYIEISRLVPSGALA